MPKFIVAVEVTTLETWEIEADDAALAEDDYYIKGCRITVSDFKDHVYGVEEIKDANIC